jgi:amino acid transporter
MTITYIFFYRACKAQGVDRKTFSYTGWFQPYSVSNIGLRIHDTNKLTIYQAYIGLGWMIFIILFYGYASFRPWSVENFFIYYTMLILGKFQYPDEFCRTNDSFIFAAFVTFFGWKLLKRTKLKGAHEVDLIWERPAIDAYEETFYGPPVSFWREMGQMIGIGRVPGGNDPRRGSVSG